MGVFGLGDTSSVVYNTQVIFLGIENFAFFTDIFKILNVVEN